MHGQEGQMTYHGGLPKGNWAEGRVIRAVDPVILQRELNPRKLRIRWRVWYTIYVFRQCCACAHTVHQPAARCSGAFLATHDLPETSACYELRPLVNRGSAGPVDFSLKDMKCCLDLQ